MSSSPAVATLICQECGVTFPRGRSKSYKAKYCPDCRGKKVGHQTGRSAGTVTALPAVVPAGIPENWHEGDDVPKKELLHLGRKFARAALLSDGVDIDSKLSVLRVVSRWDDEDEEDPELRDEFAKMYAQARGFDPRGDAE